MSLHTVDFGDCFGRAFSRESKLDQTSYPGLPVIHFFLQDAETTQALGRVLGQTLPAGTVLLLEGDLGSGKTTLVQGIGQGLGIADAIVSPTFTLINEYMEGRVPLYHADLYRLEPNETGDLHLDLYWTGMEFEPGIVAIEWAERLQGYLPDRYLKIRLTPALEGGRKIQFMPVGDLPTDWIQAVKAVV